MNFNGSLERDHYHRDQYYQKNPRALIYGVVCTVAISLLGLYLSRWIGFAVCLALGLIGLCVLPSLKTKVIEKTHNHYEDAPTKN